MDGVIYIAGGHDGGGETNTSGIHFVKRATIVGVMLATSFARLGN
jgi:hypothetical protein